MNKKKIFKIIFVLSFLPYIILVLISIYYACFGYDVYTWILAEYVRTIYGMDAFIETLFWNSLMLCLYIPILPIVVIYQIIYVVVLIIRKIIQKRKYEKLFKYLS